MPTRRVMCLLSILAFLLGAWPLLAAAQETTPGPSGGAPLDLAAMALTPDDVPAGYFDDYSEWWVLPAAYSELVIGTATPAGLVRVYQTFYFNPAEIAGIHVFLYEFASPAEAAAGTAIVAASLRPPLPEGTTIGPTLAPGPSLGDDLGAITTVTYDTWAAGGPRADVVATSFRRGRLIAGVAAERYIDPPAPGSPVAVPATPVAPDPAQEQLATDLAALLAARIEAVEAGQGPAGADLALAETVLPLDQLVDAATPVFGGYKSGIDLLRCGICGEENSLLPFADTALGGFSRALSLGPLVDGEPQPPFVSVAVSVFRSSEAALQVLEAMRQAPQDRPTPAPFPRGTRELAADPTIPGATAALAFQATFGEDADAPVDSAGVDFVVGDRLVTVDVLGGLSAEVAMAAAIDLATQQAGCLVSDGPCETVTLPPGLPGTATG